MHPTQNPDPSPESEGNPPPQPETSGWTHIGHTADGGQVYFAPPGSAEPLSVLEPLTATPGERLPDVPADAYPAGATELPEADASPGLTWDDLRQRILRQHTLDAATCPLCGGTRHQRPPTDEGPTS